MGRKRESTLIPFLIEAGKVMKYGSCLMYGANPERFRIHLPRKTKITCTNCTQMLEDWNSSKGQNKGAQYSRAKHAILVYLNKSPYVDKLPKNENYADRIPENKNYCWYTVLSSKETEEKRLRKSKKKLNPISIPSPGSKDYGTNSSGCSLSTDQDSYENGCHNITNNLSNNQNEWEIQQHCSPIFILSQPSTSESYDSTYETPLSADPPYRENQSPYSANNSSSVDSGIESPMSSDDFSTTNETTMETELADQGFVQARDDIRNATSEHINTSNHQQFEVSGAEREIQDTYEEVVEDCLTYDILNAVLDLTDDVPKAVWDSKMKELYNAHCLRNENEVAKTDERFPGVMRYTLIEKFHFEETVLLILKAMGEVSPDSESNVLPLIWRSSEVSDRYLPRKITSNISGYFQFGVIESIRSSQTAEFKEVEGFILCFLKPLPTMPRTCSPDTDGLN